MIDGHPPDRSAWLLCLDVSRRGCIECLDLPEDIAILDYEEVPGGPERY